MPVPSSGGKEVLGVDLVLLDSDTMGLVSCFLANKGYPTIEKLVILESCLHDLEKVIPHIDQNEEQYFGYLKQLAQYTLLILKNSKF